MCSCTLRNRYIWLVFNIVKVGCFLTLEQSVTQVCGLVTRVLNWCQIILSAWLALRWPYAVDGMLKINPRTSWLVCCPVQVYKKIANLHPNMTVYRKKDLPERWHYKQGPYVAPLTAMADLGWFIITVSRSQCEVSNFLRTGACSGWPGVVHNHGK